MRLMSEKKPTRYMIQEDCFAINEYLTGCKCLDKLYCKIEDCNFYRPNDELSWNQLEREIRNYEGGD